jgi:hypothetical protein
MRFSHEAFAGVQANSRLAGLGFYRFKAFLCAVKLSQIK